MTIAIIVLVAMFVISTASLVVALVVGSQRATSNVNVKYVSNDVSVKVEANYYVGGVATAMVTSDNKTFIELKPKQETGSLNQPSNVSVVNLSAENDRIIYEYIFTNMSTEISATIDQTVVDGTVVVPTDKSGKDNAKLTYKSSSTQLGANASSDNETYSTLALPAGTKRYVYVIVSIKELLYNMQFNGDFGWTLSKGDGSTEAIVVDTTNSKLYNKSTMESLQLVIGVENVEPEYPMIEESVFLGWYLDFNCQQPATFPIIPTASTKLYPLFRSSTTSGLAYSYDTATDSYKVTGYTGTDTIMIIPDVYNGTNGVKPVTGTSGSSMGSGIINKAITSAYIPRSITSFSAGTFWGCSNLTQVVGGGSNHVVQINGGTFWGCSKLSTISLAVKIVSGNALNFNGCSKLTAVTLSYDSTEIGLDEFDGCTLLTSIVIPRSVTKISASAFGSTLTSAKFENISGWKVDISGNKKSIALSDTDYAANAKLLTTTYSSYNWTRS